MVLQAMNANQAIAVVTGHAKAGPGKIAATAGTIVVAQAAKAVTIRAVHLNIHATKLIAG